MRIGVPEGLRPWLLLAPALVLILGLFVGGVIFAVSRSFGYMPIIGLTTPNLDAYTNLVADVEFQKSILSTIYIAATSTLLSAVIAVGCVLVLRRSFRGKSFVTFMFQLNLPIPHIVGAVAMVLILSQSGFLSRVTYATGLTSKPADFPVFVNDPFSIAIIVHYIWKEVPFIGVIVLATLQSIGEDYESQAQALGASPWQRFRFVLLPLILPALSRASIIVFAFVFGTFEVPYLLGQTYPAALPVLAFRRYSDVDLNQRPEAMALAAVITVLCLVLIYVYKKLSERFIRAED